MRSRPITAADFHLFANCPSGNWIENYRLDYSLSTARFGNTDVILKNHEGKYFLIQYL